MSVPYAGARAALLAAAILVAGPAFSHITLEVPQATIAGSYKAVLRVPHGCKGSATTAIRVQIPEGMIGVKPQPKAGWTLHIVKGKYAKPHKLYSSTVDSGVQEISWTGGSLPDEDYDEFTFMSYLSGDLPAGGTLYLPVVQECGTDVTRWIDKPSGGKAAGHHEGTPAPTIKLLPKQH